MLLNFSNQIAIGRNLEFNKFSVFNNQLHDNSHFIQINLLVLVESIGFSNFIIYNNSFQKAFIKIASKFHVIFFEFSNSIFMENEILEGLVQLSFQSEITQNLLIQTLTIANNNLNSLNFLNFEQQFFVFSGTNLNISIVTNFVLNNFCSVGPCGFFFYSLGFYEAMIFSSNFSNNLALYQSDVRVSCVILMDGTINLTFSSSVMKNNSINEFNPEIEIAIFAGDKGNPCIFSDHSESYLSIFGSSFIGNFGYSLSSCIYFSGNQIEVSNSSFESSISNGIEIFFLDVITILLQNVFFSEGNCGGFAINSQREIINIHAENIIIMNNSLTSNSFIFFACLKYFISLRNITFFSNECFGFSCFLYIFNGGSEVDFHIGNVSNSYFASNQISNSGMIALIVIGSMTRLEKCSFRNNTSLTNNTKGTLIFIYGENISFGDLIRCVIIENSVFGGVACIELGNLTMENCSLELNYVNNMNGNLNSLFFLY